MLTTFLYCRFHSTYLSRTARHEHHDHIVHSMMLIVRDKLCGRTWPPTELAVLDKSSIAVLSARLLLDYAPASSEAREIEEEQVRGNLRMLYSVHRDLQSIATGYSPEPLIAEAAAQIM